MRSSGYMIQQAGFGRKPAIILRLIIAATAMIFLLIDSAPKGTKAAFISGSFMQGVSFTNTPPDPDTITTCKLTVTGGGIPLPPKPPFPPVIVITCPLTITGGGTPPPPKPPFPGVTITTPRLTITGISK